MGIIFKGVGACIPETIIKKENFKDTIFYDADHHIIDQDFETIAEKFQSITGIEERRYGTDRQQASDLGTIAALEAIKDAGIDPEQLDGIFVAHNFGDIPSGKVQSDMLPSLAARIKHNLRIRNPDCIALDILFGCPGWIQGVITAIHYIRSGEGNNYLVIGTEMLSRVLDPHDRDSMIYADGAGAVIVSKDELTDNGIISTASRSFTLDEAYYLFYGQSNNPSFKQENRYIKMHGRKIYELASKQVPAAMKICLEKSGYSIHEVKKVFIHQANEKMDYAIISRFYKLFDVHTVPENIMPMSIHLLGNSSVATVPTLLHTVWKGLQPGHQLHQGDIILLASVGAGMNVNAIVYKV